MKEINSTAKIIENNKRLLWRDLLTRTCKLGLNVHYTHKLKKIVLHLKSFIPKCDISLVQKKNPVIMFHHY